MPPKNSRATNRTKAVQETFAFLKNATRLDQLYALSIPMENQTDFLVPFSKVHADDPLLAKKLNEWNGIGVADVPAMQAALRKKFIDDTARVLFLVTDRHGHVVGQMAVTRPVSGEGRMEIDSIAYDGEELLPQALKSLVIWVEDFFLPESIGLRIDGKNPGVAKIATQVGFAVANAGVMEWKPVREQDPADMILTAGPLISGRETSYALDAVRTGWNHHWADYHKRFDKTFCQKLGRKHALLTASCTGALHLALLGVGIKAGDEVIVPELTWVATASAAVYCGAKPVFVDVQPDTWCMDPQAFKAAITPRTKAVMPVHLYGHPANLKEICAIAKQHNIAVVEDAAAAYGSYVEGKAAGTYGDVACFSFQGAKTLVTGEGGIMLTDDDAIFERANAYAEHGRAVEGGADFWIDKIGFKYKMANTLAAVGLGQLEQAEMIVEAKRRLYEWYKEGLDGVPGVTLLGEAPWAQSAFWMNSIMLSDDIKLDRNAFRAALRQRGVDSRNVFPAISSYPMWESANSPIASRIGKRGINIPSGVRLRRHQIDYVCRQIKELAAA